MQEQTHPAIILPEKLFRRLKSLKAHNLHGECYQEAAQALGDSDEAKELARQFERINRTCAREGHLRAELYQQRHNAYEKLLQLAQSLLSQAQYDKFYMCF